MLSYMFWNLYDRPCLCLGARMGHCTPHENSSGNQRGIRSSSQACILPFKIGEKFFQKGKLIAKYNFSNNIETCGYHTYPIFH
jgi:hypothetical protein